MKASNKTFVNEVEEAMNGLINAFGRTGGKYDVTVLPYALHLFRLAYMTDAQKAELFLPETTEGEVK